MQAHAYNPTEANMNKPYQPDELRQKQDFEKAKREYAQADAEQGEQLQKKDASRTAPRGPDEEE
ncbi:hypothetical protein GCM10028795_26640 [Lysobacter olei]